jgi:hypothetical protein
MYKLIAKISPNKLAPAIMELHKFADEIVVTNLDSPAFSALNGTRSHTPSIIKGVSKAPRRGPKPGPKYQKRREAASYREQIREVVEKLGTAQFRLADLLPQTRALGIGDPNVYRYSKDALKAGELRKIEKGVYQRTGASIIGSLPAVNE